MGDREESCLLHHRTRTSENSWCLPSHTEPIAFLLFLNNSLNFKSISPFFKLFRLFSAEHECHSYLTRDYLCRLTGALVSLIFWVVFAPYNQHSFLTHEVWKDPRRKEDRKRMVSTDTPQPWVGLLRRHLFELLSVSTFPTPHRRALSGN